MGNRGILGQARSQGYRDGFSQAAQACYDDAYERGRASVRHPVWRRWVLAAFLAGMAIGWALA